MKTMIREWIGFKHNQYIMLIAFLIFFLVLNGILPAKDKIAYLQSKIDHLKDEKAKLSSFLLHQERLQSQTESLEKEIESQRKIVLIEDPESIAHQLGLLQKENQMEILKQETEVKNLGELRQITAKHKLRGNYPNWLVYLRQIEELKEMVAISKLNLMNLEPTSEEPLLNGELHVTFFSTEKGSATVH